MHYRIVALDIDGTLLNDDYEVTAATKEALKLVHDQGTKIVLCTGRSPENSIPILESLGLEGVLITHNGAVTVQTPGPKVLHQFSFPVADTAPLIHYCREQGVHFDVCSAFHLYLDRIGETEAAMYEKYMVKPVFKEDVLGIDEPIVKLTVFGSEEQMDQVERQWEKNGIPTGMQMIRSGIHFIDVMKQEVSKGNALKQLAEGWKVDRASILAVGNYYNDVDMIRFAGLGVAMDNSPEAVKQAADKVTLSNNEEGVFHTLKEHCLHQK